MRKKNKQATNNRGQYYYALKIHPYVNHTYLLLCCMFLSVRVGLSGRVWFLEWGDGETGWGFMSGSFSITCRCSISIIKG